MSIRNLKMGIFTLLALSAPLASASELFLSDIPWSLATNGNGAVKRNKSTGVNGVYHPLTIGGRVFQKGFGVAAPSKIRYALDKKYTAFSSSVGVDDEVVNAGSVEFKVYGDGKLLYQSGVMKGKDGAKSINVSVAGVTTLELLVTKGPDNAVNDHADWGNAKLVGAVSKPAPEPKPTPGILFNTGITADCAKMGSNARTPIPKNAIDVTDSPYRADKSGKFDSTAAISAAIRTSRDGDVILFPKGDYKLSTISVPSRRALLAERGTNLFSVNGPIFRVDPGASGYLIEGFQLVGGGILMNGASDNGKIRLNGFRDIAGDALFMNYASKVTNTTIEHNDFQRIGSNGILSFGMSTNSKILNNTFNGLFEGIHVFFDAGSSPTGRMDVSCNELQQIGRHAIELQEGGPFGCEKNAYGQVSRPDKCGIPQSYNLFVEHNYVHNWQKVNAEGMALSNATGEMINVTIRNNRFLGENLPVSFNATQQVKRCDYNGDRISNEGCLPTNYTGVELMGQNSLVYENNYVSGFGMGAWLSTGTHFKLRNNVFCGQYLWRDGVNWGNIMSFEPLYKWPTLDADSSNIFMKNCP